MQPNDRTEATLPDAENDHPSRPGPNETSGVASPRDRGVVLRSETNSSDLNFCSTDESSFCADSWVV